MNKLELNKLNLAIRSLHDVGDVSSYDIDTARRIDFPRGFLKTLYSNRSFLSFLNNKKIQSRCQFFSYSINITNPFYL